MNALCRHPSQQHRNRAGSAAVEFALVLVPLVFILGGTIDYGWFFMQQARVTEALRNAARAASYQVPDEDEDIGCTPCENTALSVGVAELQTAGFTVSSSDLAVSIEAVGESCAVVIQPSLSHSSMMGLIPVPSQYNVRVAAYAQSVRDCL